DGTVLSVGPSSRVALDTFVYDPDPSRQKMVISMTRGVLRFATGRLDKNAYVIATPSATIAVRGTVFTVAIDREGGTTIHVEEGRIRAVNPAGAAIEAGAQGSVWLQAPVQGVVPAPIGPLMIGPGGQVVAMDQILEGGGNPNYNGPQPDQFEHYRQHNQDNNNNGGSKDHRGGNSPGEPLGRLERRHARQGFAFEPFEEGAAGGRDIGKVLDHAGLRQGGDGVAAAGDAEQPSFAGQRGGGLRHRGRAGVEGLRLEGA